MKYLLLFFLSSPITFLSCSSIYSQTVNFAEPLDVSLGSVSGVSALDVADLNQDGLVDVIVLEGGAHSSGRFTLAWFEQIKSAEWLRHDFNIPIQLDDFIGSARCEDMDRDGDIDLVFTNDGHSVGPINIYLLINPGRGEVYLPWKYSLISKIEGFHANDMRIEDIDNDGLLDVIVRHKSPESVKIIFQNENNHWEIKNIHEGQAGEGLAVGDINSDGLPDITLTGHWLKTPANPRTGIYKRFDIEPGYKFVNPATKEEVGDINGDGRLDVLLSPAEHFKKYGGANYDLAWYECPPNPEEVDMWPKHIIRSDYNKAHCAKLADFDMDGDLDVLTAVTWDQREIRIYLNDNATFQNSLKVIDGKGIYSGDIADMDGDGDIDIVAEDKYAQDGKPWYYENLLK